MKARRTRRPRRGAKGGYLWRHSLVVLAPWLSARATRDQRLDATDDPTPVQDEVEEQHRHEAHRDPEVNVAPLVPRHAHERPRAEALMAPAPTSRGMTPATSPAVSAAAPRRKHPLEDHTRGRESTHLKEEDGIGPEVSPRLAHVTTSRVSPSDTSPQTGPVDRCPRHHRAPLAASRCLLVPCQQGTAPRRRDPQVGMKGEIRCWSERKPTCKVAFERLELRKLHISACAFRSLQRSQDACLPRDVTRP